MTKDEFLEILYKDLDGNIEVREVPQNKADKKNRKRYFFKSEKQLLEYVPPTDKHIYCSMYSRHGKNGTAAATLTTKVLWADYDYKTVEEVKDILNKNKIPEASVLVNSGNGVHAYWVLNRREGIEAESIVKAIAIRTGADTAAAERARVMRMPGTFNIKAVPKECKIIEHNSLEYSLEKFKEVFKDELYYMQEAIKRSSAGQEIKELKKCSRACIRAMAKGTTEGHRNFALCKITKWLQLRGYTRRAALDVIRRWNTLNNPPKPDKQALIEFNKVWEMDYKFLGCTFKNNKTLQEQSDYFCAMGECKHATIQDIQEITSDNSSQIDNLIFNNSIYRNIRGMDLAIFFTVAKAEGITREHLAKIIGVYKKNKNFIKAIEYLQELKLIQVIKGNKRAKEKDLLILNKLYNNGRGYTIINNLLSEVYLGKRITDTEYKLLVLLKSYSYSEEAVYPTLKTMAFKLGKTTRTVSSTLKKLHEKLYIKTSHPRREDGTTKLKIKLQF